MYPCMRIACAHSHGNLHKDCEHDTHMTPLNALHTCVTAKLSSPHPNLSPSPISGFVHASVLMMEAWKVVVAAGGEGWGEFIAEALSLSRKGGNRKAEPLHRGLGTRGAPAPTFPGDWFPVREEEGSEKESGREMLGGFTWKWVSTVSGEALVCVCVGFLGCAWGTWVFCMGECVGGGYAVFV